MDETAQDISLKAFKVILVGTQSVGKSSILCQLVNSQFPSVYQATVGIDYHNHSLLYNGKTFSLQIWDTAGQEKFRALTGAYFKNCSACLCVYDLSDKESIEKADYYLNKAIEENIPESCTFLVGNKSDLISDEEEEKSEIISLAQDKAQKYGIMHATVSAKEGKGITELFNDLAKNLSHFYDSNNNNKEQRSILVLPKLNILEHRQNCQC